MTEITMTINKALVMKTALVDRKKQLTKLLEETAQRTKYRYGDDDKNQVKEPAYDVTSVDTLISEINLAIYEIDGVIKTANAKNEVTLAVDFKTLMAPLKKG